MLKLSNVTLLMAETRQYGLGRMALDDSRSEIKYAEVAVATPDKEWLRSDERHIHINVNARSSSDEWGNCVWHGQKDWFNTSHALMIQPDSWVVNADCWDDEFLEYDYIGAPWWYGDERNVGNGGFKLVSQNLCQELAKLQYKHPDDEWVCRRYRPALERAGVRFAPDRVAEKFSFECVLPECQTFGFHGFHNFPRVLSRAKLIKRLRECQHYYRGTDKWTAMLATIANLEVDKIEEAIRE